MSKPVPERPKRGRGRPKGASRLHGTDEPLLRKIAAKKLDRPDAPLATLIRDVLPNASNADVARLRIKWNTSKETLIAHERERRGELGFLPQALSFLNQLQGHANSVIKQFRSSEFLGYLTDLSEAASSIDVVRGPLQPSFDVDDPSAVAEAVARFERHAIKEIDGLEPLVPEDMSMSEMPKSLHYYSGAIILFDLYLQQRAKEEASAAKATSQEMGVGDV